MNFLLFCFPLIFHSTISLLYAGPRRPSREHHLCDNAGSETRNTDTGLQLSPRPHHNYRRWPKGKPRFLLNLAVVDLCNLDTETVEELVFRAFPYFPFWVCGQVYIVYIPLNLEFHCTFKISCHFPIVCRLVGTTIFCPELVTTATDTLERNPIDYNISNSNQNAPTIMCFVFLYKNLTRTRWQLVHTRIMFNLHSYYI